MRFSVLGPLTVTGASVAGMQRLLLAVLLSRAGTPVPDAFLLRALWGEEEASAGTLRWHVHRLRRLLGEPALLRRTDAGYLVDAGVDELDAAKFAVLYRAALDARAATATARAAGLFTAALGLWRGDAYGDLATVPALRAVAARLEEQRMRALECLNQIDLARGRPEPVVARLRELAPSLPPREQLWRQLMLAECAAGRPVDALAAFAMACERFREELGADPSPSLRDLHRGILCAAPMATTAVPPAHPDLSALLGTYPRERSRRLRWTGGERPVTNG
ncbi:hypothetical protein Afil01_44320 [Actinorhabdospora filicis]|uniref:OmpR/PhoB-type domain-containing protein n=1 Tax=Actinorhabdospora filicis TaxID=1785913 RepID=A0A9W6WCC1_9ACTN|nr:AfsR/SARP family transcriptional regulator [Actinorhabdospora filicis]GLZ79625.1 hypothetical protein Afil01_44320 [Actinorhabdospora filicis]